MPVQRGYRDACGIAHALDLVGERWALLVVRELIFGSKRFSDLQRGLPAASPNALTDRLRELAAVGIVRRHRLPPPANAWVYELTEWGRGLEPILVGLGDWAVRSSLLDGTAFLSTDSLMLTIRTYYRPDAKAPSGVVDIRLRHEADPAGVGDRIGVWLDQHGAHPRREIPPHPDTTLTATTAGLAAVFGDRSALTRALRDGRIHLAGDRRLATRLISDIRIPDPAPAEARR
jgi:DNA-binding HxlR family transcriptional regulator